MFHGLRSSVSRRDLARDHDFAWLDEQRHQCVVRSIAAWRARQEIAEQFDQVRPGTRRERVGSAGPLITCSDCHAMCCWSSPRRALSTYHFLRVFKQAHSVTPVAFVRRSGSTRDALLDSTVLPVGEVAARIG
jgi:transcriptional regulator GlxA family with amidase domain